MPTKTEEFVARVRADFMVKAMSFQEVSDYEIPVLMAELMMDSSKLLYDRIYGDQGEITDHVGIAVSTHDDPDDDDAAVVEVQMVPRTDIGKALIELLFNPSGLN